MSNTLLNAMQTEDTHTTNGMTTNSTTLNHCVDLFFHIGAMRGQDATKKINSFVKAFNEDALTALKLLFWVRDIRGGAGERQTFKDIILHMVENQTEALSKNLSLIPEFGRWDDLLILFGTKLESQALELITEGLKAENGLCAKWMPRPTVKSKERKAQANILRKHLKLTPKQYRQLLVKLSNTVEQSMCSGDWTNIKYSHIPSKAMSDYMKAFRKHDNDGFVAYLESVEKGESKINASAVYPYDITKNLVNGDKAGADVQWKSLPNYMEDSKERVLPMVDVSPSMGCSAGDSKTVTCKDVAISLGMYISERNVGAFKDAFVTFSESPTLEILKGSLSERFMQTKRSKWGGSTNLEASLRLILDNAVKGNVPESEMPTTFLILSDMQFNRAVSSWRNGTTTWNPTAQQMITKMYSDAGYKMPKIVYWNLHSHESDSPVQFDESGVALVSGFSPSLLTNLLSGGSITPYTMMMSVVESERYSKIKI